MFNHKGKFFLKGTHILASVLLIAISIVLMLGMLITRHSIVIFKPYLEFHIAKPLLLLLFGSILLIATGFLGIFSAIHDWRVGIQTFVFFVSSLLMSIIGLSTILFLTSHSADDALRSRLIEHVANYSIYCDVIDRIQLYFPCCGVDNYTDYNQTLGYEIIPGSCCESNSPCGFTDVVNLHVNGCYDEIKALLNYCIQKLIVILVVLGSIEIISIILSLLFISSLPGKVHEETRIDGNNNDAGESVQTPRVTSSSLDQGTYNSNSSSTSVLEKTPAKKYNLPLCNYVRRPIEQNFVVDYRNPHEHFLRSPPQQRYDRRIFKSNLNPMKIHFADHP